MDSLLDGLLNIKQLLIYYAFVHYSRMVHTRRQVLDLRRNFFYSRDIRLLLRSLLVNLLSRLFVLGNGIVVEIKKIVFIIKIVLVSHSL
jgi:hypothetical protein